MTEWRRSAVAPTTLRRCNAATSWRSFTTRTVTPTWKREKVKV